MIYLFLSVFVGLGFAFLVWAIFVLEKDLSPNTLRRLDRIKRKSNEVKPYTPAESINLAMHDTVFQIRELENFLKKYKITAEVKNLIKLADVNWHIETFLFFSFMCSFPFLFFIFTALPLFALLSIVGFFIPTMYLKYLINKRFLDFSKQFPDALNLMASSLRAGHPLFSAIDIVTDEMPKPICDVFQTAKKDISLGIDTKDAFFSMTKIMPQSIDLRFFITAVLIQKEVGGNLAELLDGLSGTIRERFKLIGQLRVQTAQTRLSGIVLAIVPIAVLLVVYFLNPQYIEPLFTTRDGNIAFAAAIMLIIAGFISIKKISNIEI